jgi:hypothetical protein
MILVGCQQPNVKNELVTVSSDTVDIFIGVDYLESYTTLRNVVQHECLYGYNNKEHTIDLFDLKERKPIKQISLEKEGGKRDCISTRTDYPSRFCLDSNSNTFFCDRPGW